MHEHTWLDYQDGGPLKCPCGINQTEFTAQGGVLPSQDTTDVTPSDTTEGSQPAEEVAPTGEEVVTEAVGQSANEDTETVTAATATPFRDDSAESVSNEPAAEAASGEGSDFAFTQQGDTPVQPVTPPAEQPAETGDVVEAPADTKSLNEVARSIIDEAMTKLAQLKEML